MFIVNPAVGLGCHYFLPSPRLPSRLHDVIAIGHYCLMNRYVYVTCLGSLHENGTDRDRTSNLKITSSLHWQCLWHQPCHEYDVKYLPCETKPLGMQASIFGACSKPG